MWCPSPAPNSNNAGQPRSDAGRFKPGRWLPVLIGLAFLGTVLVLVPLGQQFKLTGGSASAAAAGALSPRPLPRYGLKIDPGELKRMERNPFADETHAATFTADGKEFSVQVRHRGAWARTWPKKPLKIFFADGHEFQGRHCLNLNSGWRDPAFIREPLAYHVYAACGVPAPIARMIRLDVNGAFFGLYVEVEQPDKPLLKRHGLKGATIYKASSRENRSDQRDLGPESAYASHYERETHKAEGYRDLQEFCHELAGSTNATEFCERRVDIAEYVNYLCAGALVQNWDGLNKNHFLVQDVRGSGKWLAVPWDLDRTFGDHWRGSFTETRVPLLLGTRPLPGPTGWNRLADRFLNVPAFRARFLARLEELIEKEFTSQKLLPLVDQWAADIEADAERDRQRWPAEASDLRDGIKDVKAVLERRRAFLLKEVARLKQ